MDTQSDVQRLLQKWLNNKNRIAEFEKKRLMHAEQNKNLRIREETCVARQVMMHRERALSTVAKEHLPETIDVLLRERAERRQKMRKSS